MKKISRLFGLAAVAAALAIALAVPAQAIVVQGDAYNNAYFQNAEMWTSANGTLKVVGVDTVAIGDKFYGILNSQNVEWNPLNQGGVNLIWQMDNMPPGLDTFTGYFAHEVVGFGVSGSNIVVISAPTADPNGVLAPGEVMRLYEDSNTQYRTNYGGGFAEDIAKATDSNSGLPFVSLGLAGGYWYSLIDSLALWNGVAKTYSGLNLMINNSGLLFMPINDPDENWQNLNVDLFFTAKVESSGTGNWNLSSNDPARFYPTAVPEPSTVLLLGAGLVGLGLWGRKRMVK